MARQQRRRHRKEQTSGWAWMLTGFVAGLIVAFVVYIRGSDLPGGEVLQAVSALSGPTAEAPAAPRSQPRETETRSEPAPESQAEPEAETEFSFYELLPNFEVVIPEVESNARADRNAAAIEQPGFYILQVGSFKELKDADRMQARLALLGIESRIQRVMIDENVFHRVRIGPIVELGQLNRIRRQLRDERIETLLMEVPN